MKNTPRMKVLLTTVSLFISLILFAQNCRKIFKDQLEPNGRLVNCSINSTVEELPGGIYIAKWYHVDTKKMYKQMSLKSKMLDVLHGEYIEYWDDGTLVTKGVYDNGKKLGLWLEKESESGEYVNGLREGEWKSIRADASISAIYQYALGDLHGIKTYFDSLGNVEKTINYEHGKNLADTMGASKELDEHMPRFPGCEGLGLNDEAVSECMKNKMLQYIYGGLRYPRKEINKNIEGTVVVRFVIEKDGSIGGIKLLRGISNGLGQEVLRLVKSMPTWIPGYQKGVAVSVQFTLPVKFKLQ